MRDCDYFLNFKNPADKWCDKLRQKVAAGKNGRLSTPHNQTNLCDKGRSFKLFEKVYSNSKFGNFLHLFIVSLTRDRRGREFAETFCFVTLTQATIVSVLFLPLLVPFAKETCQTCDNNKSHSYCHFLELFVGHAQQFRR